MKIGWRRSRGDPPTATAIRAPVRALPSRESRASHTLPVVKAGGRTAGSWASPGSHTEYRWSLLGRYTGAFVARLLWREGLIERLRKGGRGLDWLRPAAAA
jgi:hypothetical protein